MKQDDVQFEAVHRLIRQGDLSALRKEMTSGLDPNLQNRYGWTILMLAAMHGKSDMAKLLLGHGADPARRNKFGDTAAGLAHLKGHMKTERAMEEYEDLKQLRAAKAEEAGEPTLPLEDVKKELGL
jgi:ankyrin repeat protein